jgi:hypothetical protein
MVENSYFRSEQNILIRERLHLISERKPFFRFEFKRLLFSKCASLEVLPFDGIKTLTLLGLTPSLIVSDGDYSLECKFSYQAEQQLFRALMME